jgi:hypothetical protein
MYVNRFDDLLELPKTKIVYDGRTMSSTNLSASLTTSRRRQLANFTFSQDLAANPSSLHRIQGPSQGSQGTGPSESVVASVIVGGYLVGQQAGAGQGTCACSEDVLLAGYRKISPAQCSGLGNA